MVCCRSTRRCRRSGHRRDGCGAPRTPSERLPAVVARKSTLGERGIGDIPRMFTSQLLPIYLNDHLAGSTFGRDLARRAAGANRDTELGDFLAELASQIEADRALLKDV